MSEVQQRLFNLLRQAIEKAEYFTTLEVQRYRELENQFLSLVREDAVIQRSQEEARQWQEVYSSTVVELYAPGTLIKVSNGFFVIEAGHDRCIDVYRVGSKAKRPTNSFRLNADRLNSFIICTVNDIEDKKLRKSAETLIAKVRLKEW